LAISWGIYDANNCCNPFILWRTDVDCPDVENRNANNEKSTGSTDFEMGLAFDERLYDTDGSSRDLA
jgi:hypothetical protein